MDDKPRRESRTERPGRPDRYVNLDRAEREAGDDARKASLAETIRQEKSTPRIDRPSPLFGRVLCPRCGGYGGSVYAACPRCLGGGYLP